MGFGLLLYGYLMLITAGNSYIDFFPDLLGYLFFWLALRKLTPYSMGFRRAKSICIPLFAVGAVTLAGQILSQFAVGGAIVTDLLVYSELAKNALLLFFHIGLMKGIIELSRDVELPRLCGRGRIGMILSVCLYLIAIILQSLELLVPSLVESHATAYSFAGLVYMLLFYGMFFFNLFLIFSCYRQICYEGEEDLTLPDNPLEKLFKKISKSGKHNDL
ncbi:MAG: hypothetical protein ACI3YK_02540 [Eubacteriales bacterium]